ncbi:MAG: hypothetical protein Q8Q67_01715 [bacterium]|nr:hypothetical protein [bacterium]
MCTACAEHDQKNCHSEGWCSSYFLGRGLSIGWYVPAIPMQGRDTYWSHAAAPAKALDWWNKLPEKKDTKNTNFVAVVF